MRFLFLFALVILNGLLTAAPDSLPLSNNSVTKGFWRQRLATNMYSTIPYVFRKTDETGHMRNMRRAAGILDTPFEGPAFFDSDLSKIIEAAGYSLQAKSDMLLELYCNELLQTIKAGQAEDGYLTSFFRIPQNRKRDRWHNLVHTHQLYNMGHFFEAAVAMAGYDPETIALGIATNCANLLADTFNPDGIIDPPGHEELELALVRLYETTRNTNYLTLAKFFLDQRGNTNRSNLYGWYSQDHEPLTEQREARGHSVRAVYAYCGMADIARELGDETYHTAVTALWHNVSGRKMYLTGAIGTLFSWEGFDKDYRLPNNTMYGETCASIANFLWNWRLFRLERDAKYLDVCERLAYNAVPGGIGLEGRSFFYVNKLQSEGERRNPWFGCACCPGNVARFIQSFPGRIYAVENNTLYMNFFLDSEAIVPVAGQDITIRQETDYPWHGNIKAMVSMDKPAKFTLAVRVPGWVQDRPVPTDLYTYKPAETTITPEISLNGVPVPLIVKKGVVTITRTWQPGDTLDIRYPMEIRRVQAHAAVEHDAHLVAFERGPVVFCAEQVDNTTDIRRLYVKDSAVFTPVLKPELLGGVMTLEGEATHVGRGKDRVSLVEKPCTLKLVPYYTRANRELCRMTVWLPESTQEVLLDPVPTIASESTVSAKRRKGMQNLNDQRYANTSDDNTKGLYCTWPERGDNYWVQYDFKQPATVSNVSVFWFDDTGFGATRFPGSWSIVYRKDDEWQPVENIDPYTVVKDDFTQVRFKPVSTDGLRLNISTSNRMAFGILEWEVE